MDDTLRYGNLHHRPWFECSCCGLMTAEDARGSIPGRCGRPSCEDGPLEPDPISVESVNGAGGPEASGV